MGSPSETQAAHQYASQIEEGFSPTEDVLANGDEKYESVQPGVTRTSTVTSSFKRALTWTSSNLMPQIPNTSAKTETRRLEEYPNGYPRLSYVLSSDESFMMYRQFGQLHSRVLLYKQDQLRAMEEQLHRLDQRDNESSETAKYLKCRADDEKRNPPRRGPSRAQLMQNIEKKLLEYGKVLKQTQKLQNMSKVQHRDHASISNFIEHEAPLVEADEDFILRREDMVALRSVKRERAWLDGILEGCLNSFLRWYPSSRLVKRVFCSEEGRAKTDNPHFHYFDRQRINYVVTFLIALVLLPVLIAPIYVLYDLTIRLNYSVASPLCIAILLVSALIFSVVLGIFTQAKRHETLAAAAG